MENVLEVTSLTKRFGAVTAVDGLSFSVGRGEIVGLLGPNGAGKTTTIHMLTGLTRYDAGTIEYFGKDLRRNRPECLRRINFNSAYNTLQGRITVDENLRVFARLYGLRNVKKVSDDLIDYFEIGDLRDRLFWSLSAGQRTRVNLIKSLINDPEVLLMDEPTASLDPDIADKTLTLIEGLRRDRALSILYTSHNMAEVARICDRVMILDHGRIVAHDTPVGLTKRIPTSEVRLIFAEGGRGPAEVWLSDQKLEHTFGSEHGAVIRVEEGRITDLLFGLNQAGVEITDIDIRKPTLEDVFLEIARS